MTSPVVEPVPVRTGQDRARLVRLVGAGAVLLVVALLGPKLLFRQAAAPDLSAPIVTPLPVTTTVVPAPATSVPVSTRNPFVPLVAEAAPAVPTDTTVPAPTTKRVTLLKVVTGLGGQPAAQVQVDDTVADVGNGQAFAGSFRVVSLDAGARCGVFLSGDQRFSLCEGQEIEL
jgi:hypothetical protein